MTFWSIIATGRTYTIHFTGSAPQNMRFHLLHAVPSEKIVLRIYFETSVRMQVFIGSSFKEDLNLYQGKPKAQLVADGSWAPNTVSGGYAEQGVSVTCACSLPPGCPSQGCDNPSNEHGANRYDRNTGYLEIVLAGHSIDSFIEIKAMPVVQVSMIVSASPADFYRIKDGFLSALASILRINPTRITIVDIVAGRRRQGRSLLEASSSLSLEIVPDPVISFKQSAGVLAVQSNAGLVNITIVRTVNIIPNCSVYFKVASSPLTDAVAGTDFVLKEHTITFLSLEIEKNVSVPILFTGRYRMSEATFEATLSQAENASLGSATLIIAIQSVYPPAPSAPFAFDVATDTQISIGWKLPEWPNKPTPELSSILQWGINCEWKNIFRNISGNISLLVPYDSYSNVNTTFNYSVVGLASATDAICQTRMQTAVGWSEWSQPGSPLKTISICGNGYHEWSQSEACDDGNTVDGDGCDRNCTVAQGWSCKDSNSRSICTSGCGNGILQSSEECEDGNLNSGDGCSSACRTEIGWVCTTKPQTESSICNTSCGDGVVAISKEQCDDGNLVPGDGCSSLCVVEEGAVCAADTSRSSSKSVCRVCGNNNLEESEICDDGGVSGACTLNCSLIAPGWNCSNICVAGPSQVDRPLSVSQTSNSITWVWNLPDGFGIPVTVFICRVAPAVNSPNGSIIIDWTGVLVYNLAPDFTKRSQQLVASNLNASTAFVMQVKACSAVGCSAFGLYSPIVQTLGSPQQDLRQISTLLFDGVKSQVCLSTQYVIELAHHPYIQLAILPGRFFDAFFLFSSAVLGCQCLWTLCSVTS
jgi:cysteine-rich repeat protein